MLQGARETVKLQYVHTTTDDEASNKLANLQASGRNIGDSSGIFTGIPGRCMLDAADLLRCCSLKYGAMGLGTGRKSRIARKVLLE